MYRKYASADILDVRVSDKRLDPVTLSNENFSKLAKPTEINEDGYLYIRTRAISSRVNKNNDGWPSLELAREDEGYGYKTFEGRPIFVDHNNEEPDRTRGVVVWSKLHVDDEKTASEFDPYYASAPKEHLPPTWVELMLEVDAKSFPKLAKEIISGNIDSVSMGANIELSKCSVCGHEAENPTEYCSHVQMKGATFEITSENGEKSHKKAYEDCYGINFFEISFVFDPADETALISDMSAEREAAIQAIAALETAGAPVPQELRKQAAGYLDEPEERRPYDQEKEPDYEEEGIVPDTNEEAMVRAWKLEQLTQHLGLSPEQAMSFVDRGGDYHDLAAFLEKYPRATVDHAIEILAKTQKEALGPPGKEHHNLNQHRDDVNRERQLNYEPQTEKLRAPQDVDTLRPDVICKKCGSDMDADSAGQFICPECGWELEPEGLDNPDLELARETDLRQDKTEEKNPEGEMETELEQDKGETDIKEKVPTRKSPVRPVAPLSSADSDRITSDMKFSDVEDTTFESNPETVDAIVSWMAKNDVEVEDEVELARILNENEEFEFAASVYDVANAIESHTAKVAAATDEAKTDAKVILEGKKSPKPQTNEKIKSDQLAPVESNTHFEVLADTESSKETDMETEKTSDRETIKRVEEDGSGVRREEEIVKEYGPMASEGEELPEGEAAEGEESEEAEGEAAEGEESERVEPSAEGDDKEVNAEEESDGIHEHHPLEKEEEKVPAMASTEGKLMEALKLAKLASGLGIIDSEEELEFAGELESSETMEEIQARAKMLERVKEAGLSKKRRAVVASRMPSFASKAASSDLDETPDEALFI